MMAKILVDYKEFKRLQNVEENYERLKQSEQQAKLKNAQEGAGQEGAGVRRTLLLDRFNEPDAIPPNTKPLPPVKPLGENPVILEKGMDTDSPVPSINVLPPPVAPSINFFAKIKSQKLIARAKKLMEKISEIDKEKISVTDNGNVYIDGVMLSGANVIDLLAATYYPYKDAVGKKEWLQKLREVHLVRGRDASIETLHSEWWYLGAP